LHPVQNQERRATKKGFSVAKSAFDINTNLKKEKNKKKRRKKNSDND